MHKRLGFGNNNKCGDLTVTKPANGYTIFAFKVTDRQIGNGTEGRRSRLTTGSILL